MSDNNRYKGERYNPLLAHCHSLSLRFDGSQLSLLGSAGGAVIASYTAASGRPDARGGFDYSVNHQRESGRGPIPAGTYWVRPDELWSNAWYKPAPRAAWGDFRLTIHPFATTVTFGRGGFFIHGGTVPGSAGCIDLTERMSAFVHDLRRNLGLKTDCQMHLTVEYSA